ncbi:unnamed protein product [Arabidopsis halleri]
MGTALTKDVIRSKPFLIGGCEWLKSLPYHGCFDHLSLSLGAYNPRSLRLGWKRRLSLSIGFFNQSGKVLYRSPPGDNSCRDMLFCAEVPSWIFFRSYRTLPLSKLQEKGFLENDKLTIRVYFEITQVVHQGKSTEYDLLYSNGVQIFASQAASKAKICTHHPTYLKDFEPKNGELEAVYFTLFYCLIETLSKSPQSVSVIELRNAQNQLTELTKVGFKLDSLKSKLEDVSLERKKAVPDGSPVPQLLKERVKNVELTLSDLQVKLDKDRIKYAAAAKVSPFGFIDSLIKRFFLSCFSV